MKKYLLIILFLAACSKIEAKAGKDWIANQDGLGPIKIGGVYAELKGVAFDSQGGCKSVIKGIDGVDFIIEEGMGRTGIVPKRIVRIDVSTPEFPTDKGIKVGDPFTEEQESSESPRAREKVIKFYSNDKKTISRYSIGFASVMNKTCQ